MVRLGTGKMDRMESIEKMLTILETKVQADKKKANKAQQLVNGAQVGPAIAAKQRGQEPQQSRKPRVYRSILLV